MNVINTNKQIIVALATPYGKSAIAAIRVCGKGCIEYVQQFLSYKLKVERIGYNRFKSGDFSENLMAVCYKGPRSYSGDDTVELFPHGNMRVCDKIIKILVESGARIAERGEFTKRAFMNGKLDLMQCEALADIIDAQTSEQLLYGNKRYNGGFGALDKAEDMLKNALSTVEAVLHYSDELEEGETDERLLRDVYGALDELISILEGEISLYAGGRIINDGFKVALIGAPNVGKSTLLNAMIGKDRAIVTDIAGTTRDTIDCDYVYRDKKFTLTDTAGITDKTSDKVEKIGIERAKQAAQNADAVVYVFEGMQSDKTKLNNDNIIPVRNKVDGAKEVGEDFTAAYSDGALEISAKHGININALKAKLYDICPKDSGALCNHRQYGCVCRCLESCKQAKSESKKAQNLELVAAALYDAYTAIEELYGEKADENIINEVFERFCVGK